MINIYYNTILTTNSTNLLTFDIPRHHGSLKFEIQMFHLSLEYFWKKVYIFGIEKKIQMLFHSKVYIH
jgi:hypothetical protein